MSINIINNDKTEEKTDEETIIPAGVIWNLSNIKDFIFDIVIGNNICVFGGLNNTYYSYDCIKWNICLGPASESSLSNLTYTNHIFLGTNSSGLYRSEDGIFWKKTDNKIYTEKIVCNKQIFVLLTTGQQLLYSYDGISWNNCNININNINGIVYVGDKFFCNNTSQSCYSIDGINWNETLRDGIEGSLYVDRLYYGNGVYVSECRTDTGYSFDGITWYKALLPGKDTFRIDKCVFGNNVFVGYEFSTGTNTVIYSLNGKDWDYCLQYDGNNIYSDYIFYNNGIFNCYDSNISKLLYSLDGINWGKSQNSYEPTNIVYNNGVLVGVSKSKNCYYSVDGCSWKSCYPDSIQMDRNIVFNDNIFIGYNFNNKNIFYSKPIKRNKSVQQQLEAQYPIGSTITLQTNNNPFCYLGFGTWTTSNDSAPYTYERTL